MFGAVTTVIGHRGAPRLAKENTIDSFQAARALGVAAIELDVRRTRDGVLVVHHDPHVHGRPIVDQTAAELPPWLPSLAAALDACDGVVVNIEIKNDPAEPDFDPEESTAAGVIAELATRSEPSSRWMISSFRIETVARCRELNPTIPTAWLTVNPITPEHVSSLATAGHAAVHPWFPTVNRALIQNCHAAGLDVNTWTCNDPERAVELAGWGIDGICTDVPDVVLAALSS